MLILLDEPNVLILDEPGNDLDTDMLAVVEDMLDTWPGTLILVTHDRYLMERVTDNQYALINGTLRHLPGGVDEYLRLAAASGGVSDARAVTNAAVATGATPAAAAPAKDSAPKISGGQQREMRKQMASLERKTETLRGKIAQAQERMSQADPSDYLALGAIQDEIATFQAQIDDMEMEWLELAEALGE